MTDSYYEKQKANLEAKRAERAASVRRIAAYAVTGVAALAGLGILLGSWYRVDEGERAVILTNGSLDRKSVV